MTAINRAIASAKRGASVVLIRDKDVSCFAEHIRATSSASMTKDDAERALRAGDVRLLGAKLRVA